MVATRSRRRVAEASADKPSPPAVSAAVSAAPELRARVRDELRRVFAPREARILEAHAASLGSCESYVEAAERALALRAKGFECARCAELLLAPDVALRVAMTESGQTEALHAQRTVIQQTLHAAQSGASAGALRCSKCGSDCVSVQQKQTRSADEGMTVFCSCDGCGVQWRMS